MNKRFKTYVKEWWKRHIVDNDPFEISKNKETDVFVQAQPLIK